MLACVAAVLTLFALVSRLASDPFRFTETIEPLRLELVAAIAVTATLGSLYLSEVAGFEPCRLCWVQRAFMYPSAILLVAAVARNRTAKGPETPASIRWLTLLAGVLSVVGLGVAAFHRYEQSKGGLGSFCDPAVPCSARWMNHFGFMTIPTMAGIGFAAIAAFTLAFPIARSEN